jgi:hypothetical protein
MGGHDGSRAVQPLASAAVAVVGHVATQGNFKKRVRI